MSILAWIVVGVIAGYLAKMISPGPERGGLLTTLVIGVVGALVGGWVFNAFGRAGPNGITLFSFILATMGAVLFLYVWKLFTRRTAVV